ncbi:MAG: hypothetical protein H7X71_03495, partial [Chitinophagales bacterium]|nr:hypothetical protein [Chitinophagales bacterium]
TLGYNQNNISLDFLAIHYSNPSKNKYAYKLENYDNEWREIGNQHAAFYPNLPPGKYIYKFVVDGNWILDPDNPHMEENEFGNGNSVLWIEPDDTPYKK